MSLQQSVRLQLDDFLLELTRHPLLLVSVGIVNRINNDINKCSRRGQRKILVFIFTKSTLQGGGAEGVICSYKYACAPSSSSSVLNNYINRLFI